MAEKEKPPSFAAMLAAVRPGTDVEAAESPRKRAAELVADGRLHVTNPDDTRGVPHIYALGGAA